MDHFRDEPLAARVVEHLAPNVLGRRIGAPSPRDARDASGLRVDFTYEATVPPVALEVTGLHVPSERALGGAIDTRLEPALNGVAARQKLGGWVITLDSHARVKDLIPEVFELMKKGESIRPGEYSSDDLLARNPDQRRAFVDEHTRLRRMGLVDVENVSINDHGVRCLAFGSAGEVAGFGNRLGMEISKNADKLNEARPRETHLAVISYDFRASRMAEKTPPPLLPEELDFLWVIHSWPQTSGLVEVWVGQRAKANWTQLQVASEIVTGAG